MVKRPTLRRLESVHVKYLNKCVCDPRMFTWSVTQPSTSQVLLSVGTKPGVPRVLGDSFCLHGQSLPSRRRGLDAVSGPLLDTLVSVD